MDLNNINANLLLDSEGQVEDYFNGYNPFHKMNQLGGSVVKEDFVHYLSQDYQKARLSENPFGLPPMGGQFTHQSEEDEILTNNEDEDGNNRDRI